MTAPFTAMLLILSEVAKQNSASTPFCPVCGERICITKHGFYRRYLFDNSDMIAVQRYCCGNPFCPRKTFSCPPHPFLPFIRLPFCLLQAMLTMISKMTVAGVARRCGLQWCRTYRLLKQAGHLFDWIKKETAAATWGPSACLDPPGRWQEFTMSISYRFYPKRW